MGLYRGDGPLITLLVHDSQWCCIASVARVGLSKIGFHEDGILLEFLFQLRIYSPKC